MAQQMHRRKSSREEDENLMILPSGDIQQPPELQSNGGFHGVLPTPPPRNRVSSTPGQPLQPLSLSPSYPTSPPSAGPYRTSFGAPRAPSGSNGHPSSPFRSTFGHGRSHSRAGSVSGSFAPPLPSPLSGTFPVNGSHPQPHSHNRTTSFSKSNSNGSDQLTLPTSNPSDLSNGVPSTKPNRRHSRLHSRNLSIFFPRPGSLPESSISEDGTQEIQVHIDEEAPVTDMPSAGSSAPYAEHKQKLKGFTFGGKPSPDSDGSTPSSATSTSRRGHHHKHSVSHNFFSFLEPGSQGDPSDLHTQPTPIPVSPWNPISPFPDSAASTKTAFSPTANGVGHQHDHEHDHDHDHDHAHSHGPKSPNAIFHYEPTGPRIAPSAVAATIGQFLLGAWLWVSGQQIGSLSCTGLGYWVVFDSFGVGLTTILPKYLSKKSLQSKIKRPYGNARIETVAMFAQSVYLMFSSVYVCKETVEHLLLSAGEGHHHHHGDEEPINLGIEFPIFLVFITLLSFISTALYFNNHAKLVNTTGNHIPPIRSVIRDALSRYPTSVKGIYPTPTSAIEVILSNPFILSPILFCVSILLVAAFMPLIHYRTFDLVLAAVQTVVTFNVAYRASVVLGTVLLQTSPERGLSGGRMEAFLRAMKEVERHPQVLHLPAPHIWQLTPSLASTSSGSKSKGPTQSLVVTMELHVRRDLGDDDVLELTKWAWERCVSSLHFGMGRGQNGERTEAEVTVGVVRG